MKMLYDLDFIKIDLMSQMHQKIDADNQYYLMGDDEDETNDLWDEYYNKLVGPIAPTDKTPTKSAKPIVDKDKYPHKCPHCGGPSYNDPVFGKVDCSKCDGKGGCKDCECDTGGCKDKGSCGGGCSH